MIAPGDGVSGRPRAQSAGSAAASRMEGNGRLAVGGRRVGELAAAGHRPYGDLVEDALDGAYEHRLERRRLVVDRRAADVGELEVAGLAVGADRLDPAVAGLEVAGPERDVPAPVAVLGRAAELAVSGGRVAASAEVAAHVIAGRRPGGSGKRDDGGSGQTGAESGQAGEGRAHWVGPPGRDGRHGRQPRP